MAQLVNVIHRGRKIFLILFSVMFITGNVKIHVVLYMKKNQELYQGTAKAALGLTW